MIKPSRTYRRSREAEAFSFGERRDGGRAENVCSVCNGCRLMVLFLFDKTIIEKMAVWSLVSNQLWRDWLLDQANKLDNFHLSLLRMGAAFHELRIIAFHTEGQKMSKGCTKCRP